MKSKTLLPLGVALTFCVLFAVAGGCSKSRPDPRQNPDFNEEAYNDPDAAMKMMKNDDVKK